MSKSELKISHTCVDCDFFSKTFVFQYIPPIIVKNWCRKHGYKVIPSDKSRCFKLRSDQTQLLPENGEILKYPRNLSFSQETQERSNEKLPIEALEKGETEPEWSDLEYGVVSISKYQKWVTGKNLAIASLFEDRFIAVFDGENKELMIIPTHEETRGRTEALLGIETGQRLEVSRAGNHYVVKVMGKAKAE